MVTVFVGSRGEIIKPGQYFPLGRHNSRPLDQSPSVKLVGIVAHRPGLVKVAFDTGVGKITDWAITTQDNGRTVVHLITDYRDRRWIPESLSVQQRALHGISTSVSTTRLALLAGIGVGAYLIFRR